VGVCLPKGTDTRINSALDALDLILQVSRYLSRLVCNLASFGCTAFNAVIYFVSQSGNCFFAGHRRAEYHNCGSDQSSDAKCGYRFHVVFLRFLRDT
jgi:hypothetical protein